MYWVLLLWYFKNFNLFLKPAGKERKSSLVKYFFLKFLVHLFLYFNQIYLFSDLLYRIYQTLVNFKRGLNGRKNAWEKNLKNLTLMIQQGIIGLILLIGPELFICALNIYRSICCSIRVRSGLFRDLRSQLIVFEIWSYNWSHHI